MRVLVTGGAGYVGRHVALELFQAGHTPELLDNLQNAGAEHVRELEELLQAPVRLHLIDIVEDRAALRRLFRHTAFDAVVHLAALKSVPESFQSPMAYYQTNVAGTLNVLEAMAHGACRKLIFSSSACVYGAASGGGAPLLEEALWRRPPPTRSARTWRSACCAACRRTWPCARCVTSTRWARTRPAGWGTRAAPTSWRTCWLR